MKKKYLLSIALQLFSSLIILGQVPQLIDYQGMARDGSGIPLANTTISVRMAVLEGPLPGTMVYAEKHTPPTNSYGLFHLMIGDGMVLFGSFTSIDWSSGDYFIQTEIDPNGGNTFIDMGKSKMATVPFAFYAANSGAGGGSLWQQNGSDIYYDAGKVGVGTSTPDAALHVEDRIRVGEDPGYPTVYGELFHEGGGTGFNINSNAGGGTWADIHFQTNGTTKMFIESSGKVGIGTTSPTANLEVNGTTKLGVAGVVISEIIEVTGTTSTLPFTMMDYPSGYTQDNTRGLSLEIKFDNSIWFSTGHYVDQYSESVSIRLDPAHIFLGYPDESGFLGKPFRMILMRVE